MQDSQEFKRTSLYDTHLSLGGRMVPFAGWEMPIQYGGILEEARAIRSKAGLFDVSHMGRLNIEGPGSSEVSRTRPNSPTLVRTFLRTQLVILPSSSFRTPTIVQRTRTGCGAWPSTFVTTESGAERIRTGFGAGQGTIGGCRSDRGAASRGRAAIAGTLRRCVGRKR